MASVDSKRTKRYYYSFCFLHTCYVNNKGCNDIPFIWFGGQFFIFFFYERISHNRYFTVCAFTSAKNITNHADLTEFPALGSGGGGRQRDPPRAAAGRARNRGTPLIPQLSFHNNHREKPKVRSTPTSGNRSQRGGNLHMFYL